MATCGQQMRATGNRSARQGGRGERDHRVNPQANPLAGRPEGGDAPSRSAAIRAHLVRTYVTCFLLRQQVVATTATRTSAIAPTFRTANALNPASLRRYRLRSRCAA